MSLNDDALPENSHIVTASFLSAKKLKDLLRRLRKLCQVLAEDDSIEAGSPEWPGLETVAAILVKDFLNHKDKEVRLYAVLACMEIFSIYAPEAPWSDEEILSIFRQTIQQLGNLAHTTQPSQSNFPQYARILELLAEIRIGIVLVDLAQQTEDENALECLVELTHTLLHSVRNEHPSEIINRIVTSIVVCLEEYDHDHGITVPVKILDEILLCVAQGPSMTVLQANSEGKAVPEEARNPCYAAAAAVIRRTHNKTATPFAGLLNGLLNGDAHVLDQSSILVEDTSSKESVWNIIYELHRIAPQILTTVIGTVSNGLSSENVERRRAVVHLLGRLFAHSSTMAKQFYPCFVMWVNRQRDVDTQIRKLMIPYLGKIVASNEADAVQEVTQVLVALTTDPQFEVRLAAIHTISETLYAHPERTPVALLHALGNRVSSKKEEERRDALTWLAKIYHKHYIQTKLNKIQQGGDDCDIGVILQTLHESCEMNVNRQRRRKSQRSQAEDELDGEIYRWIPRRIFESACFTDKMDHEMRTRVFRIVDDQLLGAKLSPTARAVGLALVIDSLRESQENLLVEPGSSNAFKYLRHLFSQRARLQETLARYIDTRAEARQCESGSEEAIAAETKAMELLEVIASLVAPVNEKTTTVDVLEKFHNARDKHIFRILATISNPSHSSQARIRAMEELPKRVKTVGDDVSGWVKVLVQRCGMGDFINAEIVGHCVLLAQECFYENDLPAMATFLACVKTASSIFPSLCGQKKTFVTLQELFSECRSTNEPDKEKEIEELGFVTCLSSILSSAASTRTIKGKREPDFFSENNFQAQLVQLCTRDGTPEQARNAVYTLYQIYSEKKETEEQSENPLQTILKTLTSSARLTVSFGKDSAKTVSALAALSAIAECAPGMFSESDRAMKAIKFSLEIVLMGRSGSEDAENSETNDQSDSEDQPLSLSPQRNRTSLEGRQSHGTFSQESPEGKPSLLDDETLSAQCRRLCATIDLLTSYIRSNLFNCQEENTELLSKPSDDMVKRVFEIFSQVIRDHGLPPSTRDRRFCKSRQDRAALRQSAAIHLMRLCDARLGLERRFLSPVMWETLGHVFLDEERVVRGSIIEELTQFLQGQGPYGLSAFSRPPKPPSLRFLSYLVLCTDGDHHADHDVANGSAANVGKVLVGAKSAAEFSVISLRKVSDITLQKCKMMGKEAVEKYEKVFQVQLMPEYAAIFSFYLLAQRPETPVEEIDEDMEGDDKEGLDDSLVKVDSETKYRILRKRLRSIFEPLVQTLGDTADNISFLIRMAELVGKNFRPIDLLGIGGGNENRELLLESKLKAVSLTARDLLLSFVKKDVNLSSYPGVIRVPPQLFAAKVSTETAIHKRRSTSVFKKVDKRASNQTIQGTPSSIRLAVHKTPTTENRLADYFIAASPKASTQKSRVHFSPDVDVNSSKKRKTGVFGGMSPIVKSASPRSLPSTEGKESERASGSVTLGSTPPSGLKFATVRSSDGSTDGESSASRVRTKENSPEVVAESHDSHFSVADTSDYNTTSETQSTRDSKRSESARRSTRLRQSQSSKDSGDIANHSSGSKRSYEEEKEVLKKPKLQKSTSSVPAHIRFSREALASISKRAEAEDNELDFDFDRKDENAGRNTRSKVKNQSRAKSITETTRKENVGRSKNDRALRVRDNRTKTQG